MRTTLKLTEIIDGWLMDIDILPATKADYRRKIGLWFRWLSAAGVEPRSPQRHHILDWKRQLIAEGKSVFTVNSYVTVIKLFYVYCDRQGYCENIGAGIRSSKRHKEYSKLPLTSEQAFRLIGSVKTDTVIGRRDRLMLSLMLFNGLRTCEVERINIGDFSLSEDVHVLYIQRKGRTDKQESVVPHPDSVEWFQEYIADRDFGMDDPLFISHRAKAGKDERLVRQTIGRIVKLRLKAIGIDNPKISAHSLRHTFGTLLVDEGMDIETIKDMMGHTDTATTRIYIEMAQQRRLLHHSPTKRIGDLILKKERKN